MTGCFILDVPCHVGNWFGWLLVPTWWHVIVALVLGSIVGAKFGWLAPLSLGLSVLMPVLLGRRKEPEPDSPDFQPPWRPRFGRQSPTAQQNKPGTFNPQTGRFNE